VEIEGWLSTASKFACPDSRWLWCNIAMEFLENEPSILAELNRVMFQAADEVESEERLDLVYEVMETIRFEQAHISWLDRLRNTASPVELRLAHEHLPVTVGEVKHLSDPFVILENPTTQFLINSKYIVSIFGLSDLSQNHFAPDAINWLDNVWYHELADNRQISTWFLTGNQVVDGVCLRTGFDSLDIETNGKHFTIPKRSIVANRTTRNN